MEGRRARARARAGRDQQRRGPGRCAARPHADMHARQRGAGPPPAPRGAARTRSGSPPATGAAPAGAISSSDVGTSAPVRLLRRRRGGKMHAGCQGRAVGARARSAQRMLLRRQQERIRSLACTLRPPAHRMRNSSCSREQRSASSRDSSPSRTCCSTPLATMEVARGAACAAGGGASCGAGRAGQAVGGGWARRRACRHRRRRLTPVLKAAVALGRGQCRGCSGARGRGGAGCQGRPRAVGGQRATPGGPPGRTIGLGHRGRAGRRAPEVVGAHLGLPSVPAAQRRLLGGRPSGAPRGAQTHDGLFCTSRAWVAGRGTARPTCGPLFVGDSHMLGLLCGAVPALNPSRCRPLAACRHAEHIHGSTNARGPRQAPPSTCRPPPDRLLPPFWSRPAAMASRESCRTVSGNGGPDSALPPTHRPPPPPPAACTPARPAPSHPCPAQRNHQ